MKHVLLAFCIASMAGNTLVEGITVQMNEPFPNIVLPSVDDGTAMSVEQFRGQKLMLHIFASW